MPRVDRRLIPHRPDLPPPRSLTERQREHLILAANGFTNAQIGRRLGVSANSVHSVLTNAYRALGACGRAHAVAIALTVGELCLSQIAVPGRAAPALSGRLVPSQGVP